MTDECLLDGRWLDDRPHEWVDIGFGIEAWELVEDVPRPLGSDGFDNWLNTFLRSHLEEDQAPHPSYFGRPPAQEVIARETAPLYATIRRTER